jgi:hypothetical protein
MNVRLFNVRFLRRLIVPLLLVAAGCSANVAGAGNAASSGALGIARTPQAKSRVTFFDMTVHNATRWNLEQGTSSFDCMDIVPPNAVISAGETVTYHLKDNENPLAGCLPSHHFVTQYATAGRTWRAYLNWVGNFQLTHLKWDQGVAILNLPNGVKICETKRVPDNSFGFSVEFSECPAPALMPRSRGVNASSNAAGQSKAERGPHGQEFDFTLDNKTKYDLEQGTSSDTCMNRVPPADVIKSGQQLTWSLEANNTLATDCARSLTEFQFITAYATRGKTWSGSIEWNGVRIRSKIYEQAISVLSQPNAPHICERHVAPVESWGFSVQLYDC